MFVRAYVRACACVCACVCLFVGDPSVPPEFPFLQYNMSRRDKRMKPFPNLTQDRADAHLPFDFEEVPALLSVPLVTTTTPLPSLLGNRVPPPPLPPLPVGMGVRVWEGMEVVGVGVWVGPPLLGDDGRVRLADVVRVMKEEDGLVLVVAVLGHACGCVDKWVCVCVQGCGRVSVCVCVRKGVERHACTCVCVSALPGDRMQACERVCKWLLVLLHARSRTPTPTPTHPPAHTRTHARAQAHAHRYRHARTHTARTHTTHTYTHFMHTRLGHSSIPRTCGPVHALPLCELCPVPTRHRTRLCCHPGRPYTVACLCVVCMCACVNLCVFVGVGVVVCVCVFFFFFFGGGGGGGITTEKKFLFRGVGG